MKKLTALLLALALCVSLSVPALAAGTSFSDVPAGHWAYNAIHAAAGPELLAACRLLGGCETGQARLTEGFRLPARYVLHTPGPVWRGGNCGEAALLASCYRACLTLAAEHGIRTVDFPSISTGVYGYPAALAAPVALRAIMDFLAERTLPLRVRMVCHREETAAVYRQAWNLWYAQSRADRL